MRNLPAIAGRFVPEPARGRCFEPATADLVRRYRARCRRARPGARRLLAALRFAIDLCVLVRECRRLERDARRHFTDQQRKGFPPMIAQDIRYGLRLLGRTPGFTVTAVLAIALGVGGTTALFSVVQRVLLRPLPYPDEARIMDVNELHLGKPFAVSAVNLQDWRARNHSFQALAAYTGASVTVGVQPPQRVDGVLADPAFFDALGVGPMLGRALQADDAQQGAPKVAVISAGLWKRQFGSDPSIVGRLVTLDGQSRTIVGIMPAGFDFPEGTDAWMPLRLTADDLSPRQRGAHYLSVVGRLAPGVTHAQAQQDLEAIERDLAVRFPRTVGEYSVAVTPLLDAIVSDVKRPLLLLFGAVGCVLLIAAMNVSNLLLARATARTSEIAIRAAVGARRGQILRQLCIESLVLSIVGGAAGLLLASWGLHLLLAISPSDLPRADGISLSVPILLFALAVSLLTGLCFGLAPALVSSRPNLAAFLKDGHRGSDGSGARRNVRHALVAVQVAVAVVLLTGAGLALRSFERLTRVDAGFDPSNVLTFDIALPDGGYPTFDSEAAFFRTYTQQLQSQSGVVAAGAVLFPPLSTDSFGGTVFFPDRAGDAAEGSMQVRSITPGYFEALRIPLRAGRLPAWSDVRHGAGVVVVSDAAVRKYWPGGNPIGKRLRIGVSMGVRETEPREIVGVVGDVHVGSLAANPPAVAYVPQDQYATGEMTMVVRTPGDPSTALPIAQAVLARIDRSIAISRVHPMSELSSRAVAAPRFRMLLLTMFAITSLLLAAIGVYGTLAFTVTQRRGEIGLRMALGARASGVMQMVARDGLAPVAAGLIAGLAAAAALTRFMRALLFGVTALDPLTFAAVTAVLALVALAACVVPARRALAVDPVQVLRG